MFFYRSFFFAFCRNKYYDRKWGGGASTYKLDASVVNANAFAYQSGQEINSQTLKTIPNGNGDITSTLKMLPNVQFDSNQMNSNTPGEIDPANVSISGGLYYQNSFIVDGMNINNDLSGVKNSGRYGTNDPGLERDASMGRSQGLNIDTFLLKSIKVQDSNVGASYGHFTGGVIEAETKRAEKDFGVNFAYQISQGNANDGAFSLTRYHVYGTDAQKRNFLNSSSASNQPKFVKHSFRSSLESKINDKFGVIASFTTTQSFIPLKIYSDTSFSAEERTQKRQSYNFFIKGSYQASDDVLIDTSYVYAPQFGIYYRDSAKNSETTMKNGGHQLGADLTINNSLGFASINTSFSYMEESRRSESAIAKDWWYSPNDKNWGDPEDRFSYEGSFGDEDNKQSDLSLKIAQNFEPYYNDSFENGFNIGAEFSYTYAYFKRLKDSYYATGATPIEDPAQSCNGNEWCSSDPIYDPENDYPITYGQYFAILNEYRAGKASMDNTQSAVFAENESKFDLGNKGDISARIGLRADYDTYMQKAPIAPRFSANYTAPWGKDEFRYNTSFTFGANRYYGRSMYSYKFNQKKGYLENWYMRFDPSLDWKDTAGGVVMDTNADFYDFTKLKIPYDDELMFGVVQEVGLFNINTKYIHRFGRDQVRRYRVGDAAGGSANLYSYDNSGKSETDVITLSIMNNTPFMAGAMSNFFSFAFDWTNTTRSFNDYQSGSYNPANDDHVIYNGERYRQSTLPVTNFAQPLSFRFSTTHAINLLRTDWTLNNFFRVRMPYNATAKKAGQGTCGAENNPCIYEDYRIASRFTWDLRLGIEKAVYGKNTFYTNIDVYNVLDKVNTSVNADNKNSPTISYELGRQFWLEIGYRY